MALDSTITEQDLDPQAKNFVQGLRRDSAEQEPDLAVDGLTDSLLSRVLRLFGIGRR